MALGFPMLALAAKLCVELSVVTMLLAVGLLSILQREDRLNAICIQGLLRPATYTGVSHQEELLGRQQLQRRMYLHLRQLRI